MQETIEMRELFVLDDLEGVIRGTHHKTHNERNGKQANLIERDRVGVVFLNSLSPTRAANGDAAVYLADAFAERGYPSFRFDLPGFGDSEEDPVADLHRFINLGGYASIASAKIAELVARFNLSGVIILGHCAGALSALYTAAVSRECRGLILMGPYFHLPPAKGLTKTQCELSPRGMQDRLPRNVLPENANFTLLHRWEQLASTGLPVLILKGPDRKGSDVKPTASEFDYLEYVLRLAGCKSRVVVRVADGANQSFSNRAGRAAARRHAEEWLDVHFLRTDCKASEINTWLCGHDNNTSDYEHHEQCLNQ